MMTAFLDDIATYYQKKLGKHGACPLGVDWKDAACQKNRFRQLSRMINMSAPFSINDIGCGYGAYYDYLRSSDCNKVSYMGWDICPEMIDAARQRLSADPDVRLFVSNSPGVIADYCIASGIFNVRLNHTDEQWLDYMLETLNSMHRHSVKGFAFNCLTRYSDPDKMKDYLYYADPLFLFDYCKRHFASQIALYHDYGLFEFTLVMRKQ